MPPLRSLLPLVAAATFILSPVAFDQSARGDDKPAEADKAAAKPADEKAEAAKPADPAKKVGIALITIKGDYAEGPQAAGLFATLTETLREGLARLEKAKDDDRVGAVILTFDDPDLGWGQVNEFRAAIKAVRAKGKPVYAWFSQPDTKAYLVASACDKVYVPESGLLLTMGLRAEVTFFKNLLDRLDVKAEMMRVGKFKSAAEPFTRTEMSEPFRQEMTELLDDLWSQMVSAVAEDRGLSKEQVEAAIDAGPLTASAAKAAKLVDGFAYEDELPGLIDKALGAAGHKLGKDYGKKKLDADFSGLTGFIELMNLIAGIDQPESAAAGDKIALIYATGAIVTGKSEQGFTGGATLGSETLIKAIEKARDDDDVKAVVLRVDSPGGSAVASDLIWHALNTLKAKKPLVASMGNVAGSGGYYISMNADAIVAEPGTITGSIGVVGGKLAFGGLLDKVGVTTSVVARGKNSGALSILTGFSDSERAAMQRMLDEIYGQFTTKAAEGRHMPVEKLREVAEGRIFSGARAKEIGLVDRIGTLDDAVALAKEKAVAKGSLGKDADPGLLILPKPRSPLEELFGPLDASASVRSSAARSSLLGLLPPDLADALSGLDAIDLLARERVLTVMPFTIRVR